MQNIFDIEGKRAIVTGGSRGLGRGMAKGLLEAGAEVVIFGSNEKGIQKTAEALQNETGGHVQGVAADFFDLQTVEPAFQEAVSILGGVDILVNNAGAVIRHPSEEFPLKDWSKILNVNLTAPFMLCQLAGREMLREKYGKIINIASLLSFSGGLTVPAYAASKGGIAQVTKALSNEWAPKGINVNAIAPGYMDTDNTEALRNDAVRSRQILERIPAGRWGRPDDLKGILLFLASSASDYVNGTVIPVDGGWMGR